MTGDRFPPPFQSAVLVNAAAGTASARTPTELGCVVLARERTGDI
jgi:hypothetical protein